MWIGITFLLMQSSKWIMHLPSSSLHLNFIFLRIKYGQVLLMHIIQLTDGSSLFINIIQMVHQKSLYLAKFSIYWVDSKRQNLLQNVGNSLCKVPTSKISTQQISYSISHLLGTVTTLWLDSDRVVPVDDCRQSGDYTAVGSSVTALPAVINGHYTVTIQWQCSDCA